MIDKSYDPLPPQPPAQRNIGRQYILYGIAAVVVLAIIVAVIFR